MFWSQYSMLFYRVLGGPINADSWAFFAADSGGALVENEIARALGGTSGTLTKLDKNAFRTSTMTRRA